MGYSMSHGGKRKGAGRPKGLGRYGESTKPIRIPVSRVEEVKAYLDSYEAMTIW